MRELLVRKRMAPWWIGLGIAALSLFFLAVIHNALTADEQGVRILLALAAPAGYLALAVIVNVRMVEVTPKGVRVWVGPVLIGAGVRIRREQIQVCYARQVISTYKGAVADQFYTAGVQTLQGRQIDVYPRFDVAEKALDSARKVAEVLNDGTPPNRIEAVWVQRKADYSHRSKVLGWGAIFIAAVIAGAIWDSSAGR